MNNDPFLGSNQNDSPDQAPIQQPSPGSIPNAPAPSYLPPSPTDSLRPSKALAIISLIAGILAMLTSVFIIGGLFGVAAIVFGIVAISKKTPGKGFALAGVITGALGILTALAVSIIALMVVSDNGFLKPAVIEKPDYEIAYEKQLVEDAKYQAQKKEFASGDTAIFAPFEVKINSIQDGFTLPQPNRNDFTSEFAYQSARTRSNAGTGKKFMIINFTIKNIGSKMERADSGLTVTADDGEQYYNLLGASEFRNEILYAALFKNAFAGNGPVELDPEQELTGDYTVAVPTTSTGLKFRYERSVIDAATQQSTQLLYTLAF